MDRETVVSSNIATAGYDAESLVMEVEFQNGNIYQYMGVPEEAYMGFKQADSCGRFLNEYIKGKFEFQKMS